MKKNRLYLDIRRALAFNDADGETKKSTDVQLLRTLDAKHGLYGRVKVTDEHLQQMVRNFDAGTFGQPIFFDVEHRSSAGAAGEITALRFDGVHLLADVTWTAHGVDAITNKRHELVSADFTEEFTDSETGMEHGAVLFGAGLTTRPFVKRMQRVQLSERDGAPDTLYLPDNPEEKNTMDARTRLAEKLKALKLSEAHQQSLLAKFDQAAKTLSDNAVALEATADAMIAAGTAVAAAVAPAAAPAPAAAAVAAPAAVTLSETDIAAMVTTQLAAARVEDTRRMADAEAADATARKVFTDAITAATNLSDETRTTLNDQATELVCAGMAPAAITKLAAALIAGAEREAAARTLSSLGFAAHNVGGSPRISVDHGNEVLRFSETVQTGLRQTHEHASGRLAAPEDKTLNDFAKRYVNCFNQEQAPSLLHEARTLSDVGQANVGSYYLPQSFTREVIREALADLNIFQLYRTVVDSGQTATFSVPYEVTDDGEILDDAVLVERQMYPRVSSRTEHDIGYVQKRGAMIDVSEEAQLFSRGGPINYEAFAAATVRCARIMRERIHASLANHLLRISDSVGAVPVAGEALTYAQTDASVIKLANLPVVQPHQQRDLNGNAIGAADNPIALVIGGNAVPMYTGLANAPTGNYYRVSDYNQGLLRLVDESGTPVTTKPAGTIGYWRVTNVAVFNMDTPADVEYEKHMNRLLQSVGNRKARMMQDQYIQPDYALMAHTLDDDISNAQQFVQSLQVPGSDSGAQGVRKIKNLPTVNAAAPGMLMGENRILLGQRGNSTYHVTQPWAFGQPRPADATDATGDVRYTGATISHGMELSGVHTPSPNAGRSTSVLVYSKQDRDTL